MDQNKTMSFEDYLARRLQPVKILVSMLNKDLKYIDSDEITYSRDELENIVSTIDIFVEEFGLAAKQKKNSRRSKASDMSTAYPAEKLNLKNAA